MDISENLIVTISGGFFTGVLVGWALKKVVKLVAIIIGLLLTGLAYLQYQQIAWIYWGELEGASEAIVNALVSTMTKMFNSGHQDVAELAITNFGIPMTSSMSIGIAIGFMKG
jgi:uncharacterized membrane protein (Fun14 family)